MGDYKSGIKKDGSLVLGRDVVERAGFRSGEAVRVEVGAGEIRLTSDDADLARMQAEVRALAGRRSLVRQLAADRRREARWERAASRARVGSGGRSRRSR